MGPPRPHAKTNRWLGVARRYRQMSQRELSDAAGLTQVAVSHIETGRTHPRLATQQRLAEALGFEVEDLWPSDARSPRRELRRARKAERR